MTEIKRVTVSTTPILINKLNATLVKSDFEALIWNKGQDVYLDKMMNCPCKNKELGGFLPSCINCGGSGYFCIERIKTKMFLQGMNLDTKMKEWSEEKIGTVKITTLEQDHISFMDRIIMLEGNSTYNEVIYPVKDNGIMFAPSIYPIKSIDRAMLFKSDKTKLKPLQENIDFTIKDSYLTLTEEYSQIDNLSISIRYTHLPQFHVIDLTRDIMIADTTEHGIKGKNKVFYPIAGIGRRSHFVLDKQNYNNTYLLDNTQ